MSVNYFQHYVRVVPVETHTALSNVLAPLAIRLMRCTFVKVVIQDMHLATIGFDKWV